MVSYIMKHPVFIVVEDLEYILKFSVYQNMSSSFKNVRFINIKSMRFLLTLFSFDRDVINICLWSNFCGK